MLEKLVDEDVGEIGSAQDTDFFTRAYDTLLRPLFGDVSWGTLFDIGGAVTGLVAGYNRNWKVGLVALGVAIAPELGGRALEYAFTNDTMNHATSLQQEIGQDFIFVAASFGIGLALRAAFHKTYHH